MCPSQSLRILDNSLETLVLRYARGMACKRSSVRSRSSPFTENAAGLMSVAFFDGCREQRIWGLTRSDPFVDPLGEVHWSRRLLYSPVLRHSDAAALT